MTEAAKNKVFFFRRRAENERDEELRALREGLLTSAGDYGRPWFGQLMAGPQMLAYMLQVNYWLAHYKIRF